ncbi:hypothetical protein C1H46_032350 [Malus baccata]|uniref:Protein BZR1 homolog n=1 Tax=Malus baccata TaxID=106549 RepID=A0A540L760_MALBA|nr:hypothetical protein C1H46_032349 [Malus baccata]TQD82112.1 hypothetical protein C1H46_032350 [Malus baccata]
MAGTSGSGRSENEKENTNMRERQRRAITTKIFHGLCKHDDYRLSLCDDINEVLRHLAIEASWLVEPDDTTYRPPNAPNYCPTCGTPKATTTMVTTTPTLSSSVVIGGGLLQVK